MLAGSPNFGLIGRFTEIPGEVVFTTEYAVRSAQTAVAALRKITPPPPVYKGQRDPRVLLNAARAMGT
jgi:oleate hydratase